MFLQSAPALSGTNLCSRFKTLAARLNWLGLLLLLLCVNAAAQNSESQPVSRLLEVRAAEPAFSRPRRINTPMVTVGETAKPDPFSFHGATVIERTAFELINQARVASGLQPLRWDAELCRMARAHSEDMGRRAFFDHETPEGLRPKERARALGVYGFRVIAENIAYNKGYEDPAALAVG